MDGGHGRAPPRSGDRAPSPSESCEDAGSPYGTSARPRPAPDRRGWRSPSGGEGQHLAVGDRSSGRDPLPTEQRGDFADHFSWADPGDLKSVGTLSGEYRKAARSTIASVPGLALSAVQQLVGHQLSNTQVTGYVDQDILGDFVKGRDTGETALQV